MRSCSLQSIDSCITVLQVDERLSDVERVILYLNGGQIIQQRQAIST